MAQRVRGTVTIRALAEDVFAFFDDPRRAAELEPGTAEVEGVEALPNGGHRVRTRMRGRGGRLCEAVTEDVERVRQLESQALARLAALRDLQTVAA